MTEESLLYASDKDYVYPSPDDPILVSLDKLYVKHNHSVPFTYGFKLTAYSASVPYDPFTLYSRDRRKFQILQRPTDGSSNDSYNESVKIEGAYGLVVIFDKTTCTPSSDSYCQFRKAENHRENWSGAGDVNGNGLKNYGGANGLDNMFPGVEEVPPMIIP